MTPNYTDKAYMALYNIIDGYYNEDSVQQVSKHLWKTVDICGREILDIP